MKPIDLGGGFPPLLWRVFYGLLVLSCLGANWLFAELLPPSERPLLSVEGHVLGIAIAMAIYFVLPACRRKSRPLAALAILIATAGTAVVYVGYFIVEAIPPGRMPIIFLSGIIALDSAIGVGYSLVAVAVLRKARVIDDA